MDKIHFQNTPDTNFLEKRGKNLVDKFNIIIHNNLFKDWEVNYLSFGDNELHFTFTKLNEEYSTTVNLYEPPTIFAKHNEIDVILHYDSKTIEII